MNENVIQVSDIIVLRYLDQFFKASETLGNWYISSLQAGSSHEQLEKYLFDTYLPTLNYTPENILYFKNEYEKFEMAYAQSIAQPQVEEVVLEAVHGEIRMIDGVKCVCHAFTPEGKAIFAPLPVEVTISTDAGTSINIQGSPSEVGETIKVLNDAEKVKEQTQNLDTPIIPSSNLDELRRLQVIVDENLNKIMLLKEESKHNEHYVNDSYKHCPSFKNLIQPVQQAIIAKRKQKANEKWFEKYRPELVEEVLFPNNVIKEQITEYALNGHIAGNCMFYGEGGVGKTTTNIILMNAVLQNVADRFFLDRKIESVDELKGWLNKKPIGKQKIVIAEEFDRLSDAAMTELKNGLMEKYEYVVFLASTNKIHKIDDALLTRFTLIAKFENAQEEDLYNKCKYILSNERIQYTEGDLRYFIENNKLKGIRTILNNLQLSCYQNVFEPKRTSFYIGNSGTEYDMVQWIKYYIGYLLSLPKQTLLYLTYSLENDPNIKQVRDSLLQTLMANYSLNYDYVFTELLKDNIFLPIKNCINVYYQDIDSKRVKPMHFEAMLNEFIMITHNTKDIYVGQ